MQVLKFGGSSVAGATRISAVLDIVGEALKRGPVILVSSAISGCTDSLIALSHSSGEEYEEIIGGLVRAHEAIARRLFTGVQRQEAIDELQRIFAELKAARREDYVTYGEILSTRMIALKCLAEGLGTLWLDSRKLVRTRAGEVDKSLTYSNIRSAVESHPGVQLFVAPGFVASDEAGFLTTLGRGGSDYSAALYAAAVGAGDLQIWTDVPGIMTANPKVVPSATTIPEISYTAALALASAGAKVLYAPTVVPAMETGIAINIRNTFDPKNPGTLVSGTLEPRPADSWLGVTSRDLPDSDESVLCLVAEAVSSRKATSGRLVEALLDAGIQALGEVGGEGSVFYVHLRQGVAKAAVRAVHEEFFRKEKLSTIGVFIAGFGAVGRELVEIIERSRERVAQSLGKSIRILGVADSKRYIIDQRGLATCEIPELLQFGTEEGDYVGAVCSAAARGSVFVDCTPDHQLYTRYEELFRRGINVVTSNRRSLAVPYVQYAAMKAAARENGAYFRYDTTVGTSLPILDSISSRVGYGDEVESIEAVVSCTLNYIISSYNGSHSESFAELLRRAQEVGLTERDPRTDLGGRDVLRKLLILSREAGVKLEESDVEITPMLGREFFDCSLDEFYRQLSLYEPKFVEREDELDAMCKRQRFVASLRRDPSARLGYKAEIKMVLVDESSPFYWISGTENIIKICNSYSAPLVIRGAGEGGKEAAVGILRDVLI